MLSEISYQQQVQDYHQDYFERNDQAFSKVHGGFYDENIFQKDDIYRRHSKKEEPNLLQYQEIQKDNNTDHIAADKNKEEKKEELQLSQPLDDIEIEERRIGNLIGIHMGGTSAYNSKLFSGILMKGSSGFLSKEEDYLQFQMSSRNQQQMKRPSGPGLLRTGDEYSFFSKSQMSYNP